MQVQRHQRIAGALHLADQAGDLGGVQQELAVAGNIRLDVGGGGDQRRDVRTDQEDLRAPYNHIRFLDLHAAGPDGLHLPAFQRQPGLDPFLDEIIEPGFPVFCNGRHGRYCAC